MKSEIDSEVVGRLPQAAGRKWVLACHASDVPDDEGYRLTTLPPVAIFTSGDRYYCIDDTCTHETYSLAEGWVEDGIVECTLHMAKFDLQTGAPLSPPANRPVAVHPVEVIDNAIYAAIPSDYLIKED